MLLAQISDLHVRPAGQRYKDAVNSNRMFADAVEHLNRLDPRPDLVLITGDLVDEGLEAEYAYLRTLLARLELPCLLMPGNHDDREMLARCFPDHAYLPARGPKHFVIDRPPLRIVALDTTVPGDHHGEVDEAGLAWLEAALRRCQGRADPGADAPSADRHRHPLSRQVHVPAAGAHRRRDRPLRQRRARAVRPCPSADPAALGRHAAGLLPQHGDTNCIESPARRRAGFLLRAAGLPAALVAATARIVTHTSYIGRFEGPFPFA